jgi:RNA polymerase sigma-70 factor (ECF subfamily)
MAEADLSAALLAAQEGDASGFALLWQSLQPAVLRYLRVVAPGAVEDVASETWLQVVRDLHGFRGDVTAFQVWLFRIARNRGIDERRRAGRRMEDPSGDLPAERPDVGDTAQDVLDGLDTEWALKIIASLPQSQAEVIMLRVVAGLDVTQTARVLGKRPGAVRVAALRGLRQLATHAEVQARRAPHNTRSKVAPLSAQRTRPSVV